MLYCLQVADTASYFISGFRKKIVTYFLSYQYFMQIKIISVE